MNFINSHCKLIPTWSEISNLNLPKQTFQINFSSVQSFHVKFILITIFILCSFFSFMFNKPLTIKNHLQMISFLSQNNNKLWWTYFLITKFFLLHAKNSYTNLIHIHIYVLTTNNFRRYFICASWIFLCEASRNTKRENLCLLVLHETSKNSLSFFLSLSVWKMRIFHKRFWKLFEKKLKHRRQALKQCSSNFLTIPSCEN